MIALRLTNVKESMEHLLLADTFDNFLFIEGEIVTFNTFTIDGFVKRAFLEETEAGAPAYSSWKKLKGYCFSLIKGKRKPLSFKLIFSLTSKNIEKLILQNQLDFQPEQVQGLYINLRYDEGQLKCITGTSLHTFTMDKSLEQAWDTMVQKFFAQNEIDCENDF